MKEVQAALIDRGLRRLRQHTYDELVLRSGLRATAIPPELARAQGSIGGSTITMHTNRYHGPGFAPLTVAVLEVEERLCSLTVIGLPPAGSPLPVLGLDLIALRGALSLIAIDLAPTDAEFFSAHCASILAEVLQLAAPAIVPRRRPDFAEASFSAQAIIAGGRPLQEAQVFHAVATFLQRSGELLRRTSTAGFSSAAAERRRHWLAAERQNRKEHNALAQLFGAPFAAQYLDDFLFGAAVQGQL